MRYYTPSLEQARFYQTVFSQCPRLKTICVLKLYAIVGLTGPAKFPERKLRAYTPSQNDVVIFASRNRTVFSLELKHNKKITYVTTDKRKTTIAP